MPPAAETEATEVTGSEQGLSHADCLCPVCLEIFLEPVTLPCSHSFCKACFLETVDKANLCCPMCRKRVSSWARLHSRNKTLVNAELWGRVQKAFPALCERRLSGKDTPGDTGVLTSRPRVSEPGELRREYEEQIGRLAEEKRALEEAEQAASDEYIQRLLAEEEEHLLEEQRRQEERQLQDDERLARLLSEELNASPVSNVQRTQQVGKTSVKKTSNAGDIGRFLFPLPQRCPVSVSPSLTADKENVGSPTKALFVRTLESTVEPLTVLLDLCGQKASVGVAEPCMSASETEGDGATALLDRGSTATCVEQGESGCGPPCTEPRWGESSGKRKSSGCGDADGTASKRSCPGDAPLRRELEHLEEQLRRRQRQQEEDDLQLALRLQRQLDREAALHAVDRTKGSADQYQLRHRPGQASGEPSPSRTAEGRQPRGGAGHRGPSCVRGGHMPASPGSAVRRPGRQTSLTDVFPSLSST